MISKIKTSRDLKSSIPRGSYLQRIKPKSKQVEKDLACNWRVEKYVKSKKKDSLTRPPKVEGMTAYVKFDSDINMPDKNGRMIIITFSFKLLF